MTVRGELGFNIIEEANNRTSNNFVSMIDPGVVFDQKVSLHYKRVMEYLGVFFKIVKVAVKLVRD